MRRRRGHRARLLALLCGLGLLMPSAQALAGDPAPRTTPASSATLPVVLLHGLTRSARSMAGLAEHLEAAGTAGEAAVVAGDFAGTSGWITRNLGCSLQA